MLRDQYADIFGVDLTQDERELLAKVSAHTAKLASDPEHGSEKVAAFIADLFRSETDLAVIVHSHVIADTFAKLGSADEKLAMNDMASSLQMLVSTLPLKQLQKQMQEEHGRDEMIRQSFKQIIQDNPALIADPKQLAAHFHVFSSFAPDIAANPTISGNMLKQLSKLGPGAMTHQFVQQLRELQGGINEERSSKAQQMAQAVQPFTRVS